MQRLPHNQTTPTEDCDQDVVYQLETLLFSLCDRRNAEPIPRSVAEMAVVCTVFPIILALARQFCHHTELDNESNSTNRMCDQDVDYQLATLLPSPSRKCDHDVVYQLDTLLPSPCNRKKNPRSKAELAVVSKISPSMLALKRQIIHQGEVRQKSSGANKNCETSSVTWRHYLAHAVGKKNG